MLILGPQNGAQIQHKIKQKTDPFFYPRKSCKYPEKHRPVDLELWAPASTPPEPGLALNGKSEQSFAKHTQLLFRSASQLLGCEAANYDLPQFATICQDLHEFAPHL